MSSNSNSEKMQLELHLLSKFKNISNPKAGLVIKEIESLAKCGNETAKSIINSYQNREDVSVGGSGIFAAIDKEMLSIVGNGTKDTENTIMWGMWNRAHAKNNDGK